MRTPLSLAVILLVAMTWLSVRGMNSDAARFDHALQSLDVFGLAERAFQRDILKGRVGSLRNYDPLVQESNDLQTALDDLRNFTSESSRELSAVDRLSALVDIQDEYAEQFKSKIALLRNSLAYFALFSSRLGSAERTGVSLSAINDISATMLRLTLDTSTENAVGVDRALQILDRALPATADQESAKALLAHGRLLRRLLPETDRLLGTFFDLPLRADQEQLRTILTEDAEDSRHEAQKFQVFAFFLSLFLLVTLVHLGSQLRARARSLRWRASVEHVIADISTSLIDCPPRETATRLNAALSRLAHCIGADRAYLIDMREPQLGLSWCNEESPFDRDWPRRAVDLARSFDKNPNGDVIHVPRVSNLAPSSQKQALRAHGVQSWACIVGGRDAEIESVLGFDGREAIIDVPSSDLRVLRMAFDALLSAISRDRLTRESAHLEEQLHQARRIQTIGAFASGVAHNFNNIIGAILGYVEIAETHIQPTHPGARSLLQIRRAGFRARNLVEQLLAFGRRRPIQREVLQLEAIVAEAHSLLSASLPPEIELIVHNDARAAIYGEPAQLQQIVLNFCHNAAQAMNEKGCIEIRTEVQHIRDTLCVSHAELPEGRYAVISVKDSGRGMTPAIISQLFEPFFTTRSNGHGLGLATVNEIVRNHGGAINVESEPDVGSCFQAWIPCVAAEQLPRAPDRARGHRYGHGETVLLLEEPIQRRLRHEEVLAALGFEPVGFSSARDALSACREEIERFDIILIGYLTPTNAVLSFASALRRLAPGKPILIAMPSRQNVDIDALIASGASQIVRWPLVPDEIASALTQSLRHPKACTDQIL
ncbi:MAG: two-component system VirA-like sensor kinase [Proteobacteria bacterium]|nr:two-component system VirA-like sensor kinase [Pseudomonadota bacterium]